MKLSEAIRRGATLRPQGHEVYFDSHGRSCALGAAFEAVRGGSREGCNSGVLRALFPHLDWLSQNTVCPFCGKANDLFAVITCLNDKHLWSREQIADWLETFEPEPISLEITPLEIVALVNV